MQHRKLGRTGLDVSLVCLGTMTFGEQNSEAEGHAQLDRARDAGVNFLDAAELYPIPPKPETQGRTEEIVGSWLAARGGRDKVVVATKAVGRSVMEWFRDPPRKAELSRRDIREAVEGSLRRLRTDYIDLYQLHWPDREVGQFGSNPIVFRKPEPGPEHPIHEILESLGELVREGKIRHVGLSNESPTRAACPASPPSRTPTASSTASSRPASPRSRCGRTSACSPIRRWRKAISPANTATAPSRPARAKPCSTGCSATRRRARRPRSRPISILLGRSVGRRPISP
jgi:hypothetical protein